MDLKDKIMVITGASSGIGRATARRLNKAGVKFVLNARSKEKLEDLAAELSNAVYVVGDMIDPETPQQILDKAFAEFGR
ncbi:MAG: SDR family oxidoreductase, partial [Desulfocapsaceae bacterium]